MVDAIRASYLGAALLLAALAFHDAPRRLAAAHREDRISRDRRYHAANLLSVCVIATWLAVLGLGLDRPLLPDAPWRQVTRLASLYVAWAGFAYALWARWTLGEAFAPTAAWPSNGEVVDEGPFGHVRHPFYLGLMVALAAGALALDSWATLAALVLLVPLVHVISRREEAHLVEALGPSYERYLARVPRWIPGRDPAG